MSINIHYLLFLEDLTVTSPYTHADGVNVVTLVLKTPESRLTLDLSPAQWRDVVEAVLPHLPSEVPA